MACVALPTCPLPVSQSQRVLPSVLEKLERERERLGLAGLKGLHSRAGGSILQFRLLL